MSLRIDTREFQAALKQYIPSTQKELSEITNERGSKVIERAWDAIPPIPGTVQAKKQQIHDYLAEPLSTKVKLAKSGKRKGSFIPRGARSNSLRRVNLIVQKLRAKAGKKGLWGKPMKRVSGIFQGSHVRSAGYAKSFLLPIIRTLNMFSRWKIPMWKTHDISRWPGSSGYGKANAAKKGWNPAVSFDVQFTVKDNQLGKVEQMYDTALNLAFKAEAAEMERHTAEKLQKIADKHNAAK